LRDSQRKSPRKIEDCPKEFLNDKGKLIESDKDRPWFDWYYWRIENWGTKWNASDTSICDKIIYFNTAWSPSMPIIKELGKKYDFIYEYAEEQAGLYAGKYEYINGIQYGGDYEQFSKEAYELYFDLWGEDESFYFDKDENTYIYDEDGTKKEAHDLKKEIDKIINPTK